MVEDGRIEAGPFTHIFFPEFPVPHSPEPKERVGAGVGLLRRYPYAIIIGAERIGKTTLAQQIGWNFLELKPGQPWSSRFGVDVSVLGKDLDAERVEEIIFSGESESLSDLEDRLRQLDRQIGSTAVVILDEILGVLREGGEGEDSFSILQDLLKAAESFENLKLVVVLHNHHELNERLGQIIQEDRVVPPFILKEGWIDVEALAELEVSKNDLLYSVVEGAKTLMDLEEKDRRRIIGFLEDLAGSDFYLISRALAALSRVEELGKIDNEEALKREIISVLNQEGINEWKSLKMKLQSRAERLSEEERKKLREVGEGPLEMGFNEGANWAEVKQNLDPTVANLILWGYLTCEVVDGKLRVFMPELAKEALINELERQGLV